MATQSSASLPSLVAFSGKLGVGKDHLAKHVLPQILGELFGVEPDIRIVATADHMKYELAARNPDMTYDLMYVNKTTEVRKRLQQYGTEEGRDKHGMDMWLNALGIRMTVDRERHVGTRPLVFVITDVRYPNEAEYFGKMPGARVIRIIAPKRNARKLHEEGTEHLATHRSEVALDDYPFPHFLHNDDTDVDTVIDHLKLIITGSTTDTE